VIKNYGTPAGKKIIEPGKAINSVKKLKDKSFGKILNQLAE
jgi:hypothetical protein